MASATFIDDVYLNSVTPIAANVDVLLLLPFIEVTQDSTFENMLGTTFYDRLQQGIIDGDLNSDERNIMTKYIRPALAWKVLNTAIPFISSQVRNKGVMNASSDNSQSASKDDKDDLRASSLSFSGFYIESLQRYLCDNSELFPTYQTPDSDTLRYPQSQRYDCDLYLGDGAEESMMDALRKFFK